MRGQKVDLQLVKGGSADPPYTHTHTHQAWAWCVCVCVCVCLCIKVGCSVVCNPVNNSQPNLLSTEHPNNGSNPKIWWSTICRVYGAQFKRVWILCDQWFLTLVFWWFLFHAFYPELSINLPWFSLVSHLIHGIGTMLATRFLGSKDLHGHCFC